MKNGFTLMELLAVIVITAVISTGSILIFSKSNSDSNEEELRGKYREIQRAANIYVDLNDSWRKTLNENREVTIRLKELQSANYVDKNFKNNVTNELFPSNYVVKLYVASSGDNEYLDSCVVTYSGGREVCIANSKGNACECCDAPISQFNQQCYNYGW